MPRTGWLAAGAAIAALTVGAENRHLVGVLVAAAGCLLLIGLWLPRARRIGLLALAIGILSITLRAGLGPAGALLSGAPAGSGPWMMVVETVGSPREGHQVATIRTLSEDSSGFRIAATLPRYPAIEPGDQITVAGRARPRPDSPYGRYLERLDAWGTLDARSMEVLERPTDPGTLLEGWRRDAGELLTRVLPEPEAGLAAGILIGLRDRVDREVAADFTTAGVSHVVAISGWNIAIVAAAVGAMAGRLGRRRRAIVTAIAVVSYIVFAGASPSVLRAGAMAGVVLLARESGRSGRAAAALGLAAFLLLLAEPALVSDAGFQLSTLATAGLVAWATPLTNRLDRLTRGRLPRWLSESLGVSLAAQAATLPIVLASFGRLALISPAVNLVVVPLVTPAMAAGLVALLGGALVSAGAPAALGADPRGSGLDRVTHDHRGGRGRCGDPIRQHRLRAGRRCGAWCRERRRGCRHGPASAAARGRDAVGSPSSARRARLPTCRCDRTDREPAHREPAARRHSASSWRCRSRAPSRSVARRAWRGSRSSTSARAMRS